MSEFPDKENEKLAVEGPERYRQLSFGWQTVFLLATIAGVVLAVNQFFNLGFLVGTTILDNNYQYALIALFVPFVFIIFPAHWAICQKSRPYRSRLGR